jgi:hypothetical protein
MGKKDELLDDAVAAYEESTGQLPDTRDYVALEDAVDKYAEESDAKDEG